jgi:hypothetical protein
VTSCTSVESGRFPEAAIKDLQYDMKNCSRNATEHTRIMAAIIGTPPSGAPEIDMYLEVPARRCRPMTEAAGTP